MQLVERNSIDGDQASARLPVWDLATRLFHWSLVLALSGAALTEWLLPERYLTLHLICGYSVGALLAFRLVWGWFGSEYSRFSHLRSSPRHAIAYVRAFLNGRAAPYLGHNPAGAAMIVVLLATLLGIVLTGMLIQAGEEKQGPFAGFVSYRIGSAARDIHALLVDITVGLVALHIAAVLLHRLLGRESLVRAMVTGWKDWNAPPPVVAPRAPRRIAALLSLVATAILATVIVERAWRVPPLGVPAMAANATYRDECGACHEPYHPSLLPAASWQKLMAGLDDHFGEDASLPADETAALTAYLTRYAGEAWDTEAGREIAAVSPDQPLRITASPHWRRKHHGLSPAAFKAPNVKTEGHCSACHSDAETGRFADQAITYDGDLSP